MNNKFIFITDLHLSATGPRSRTDNYVEALLGKLKYVIKKCYKTDVTHLLLGGDLFDHPSIGDKVAGAVAKLFTEAYNEFGLNVYAIIGNHDVYGKNADNYDDAKLALFSQYPWFNLFGESEVIPFEGCNICGINYAKGLELVEGVEVDKKYKDVIVMLHSMVTGDEKSTVIKGNKIMISYKDMKFSKNVKLVLSGHYHPGYDIKKNKGVIFSNPGSFSRTDRLVGRTSVGPGYTYVEIEDGEFHVEQRVIPHDKDVFEASMEGLGEVDEVTRQLFMEALVEFKSEAFTMEQLESAVYNMIDEDLGLNFRVDQKLADFIVNKFKEKNEGER